MKALNSEVLSFNWLKFSDSLNSSNSEVLEYSDEVRVLESEVFKVDFSRDLPFSALGIR
jgi:hypothetical protein